MIAQLSAWYGRWGLRGVLVRGVLAALLAVSLKDAVRQPGSANLHAHQAHAFLHGRLDIVPGKEYVHDLAAFDGRQYCVFPPFPAALLMPLVAVCGMEHTNVVLLCLALSILNLAVLGRILERLQIDRAWRPWLLGAFFLGTAYWLCLVQSAEIYFYAHITAVTCILLATHEAVGRGRAWLVGLCLGAAVLSRQLSVYSALFLGAALFTHPAKPTWQRKVTALAVFGLGLGLCIGLYCLFNLARFGNPFDTGYQYMPLQSFLAARVERYGVFHTAYVPFNFIHMFLQGFHVSFAGREQLLPQLDRFGTSLTMASPFVFLAFWARGPRLLLAAAWASVAFTLAHLLLYYNNGFVQFNAQRFTLDFMPILILLVALGVRRSNPALVKGLIVYAVSLNIITLIGIPLVHACLLN